MYARSIGRLGVYVCTYVRTCCESFVVAGGDVNYSAFIQAIDEEYTAQVYETEQKMEEGLSLQAKDGAGGSGVGGGAEEGAGPGQVDIDMMVERIREHVDVNRIRVRGGEGWEEGGMRGGEGEADSMGTEGGETAILCIRFLMFWWAEARDIMPSVPTWRVWSMVKQEVLCCLSPLGGFGVWLSKRCYAVCPHLKGLEYG